MPSQNIQVNSTKDGQLHEFLLLKNQIQECNMPFLRKLLELKCLYSQLMPKMPREYLVKLIFDSHHESLVILKNKRLIAGITFRGFRDKKFYQIAFLAVNNQNRCRGLGTILMNRLKAIAQQRQILTFFTFADDKAVRFFQKQGFSSGITTPSKHYQKYLKEYVGGQLMQCKIDPRINYGSLKFLIEQKKQQLLEVTKNLLPDNIVYQITPNIVNLKKLEEAPYFMKRQEAISLLPGLKQAGFQLKKVREAKMNISFLVCCQQFINCIRRKEKHLETEEKIRSFKALNQMIERKLATGSFMYKKELIQAFQPQLLAILHMDKKLSLSEKQLLNYYFGLKQNFLKNLLPNLNVKWSEHYTLEKGTLQELKRKFK